MSAENNFTDINTGLRNAFEQLQLKFTRQFQKVFFDPMAKKCVVIVPSLTLDQDLLAKISGQIFYEERLLCLLMLLRMPRTHIVYVSSTPIDPIIIDYYLQFLPGITREHALRRTTFLSCYDSSNQSLTQKLLARPKVVQRIKSAVPTGHASHLACFNVTEHERDLALQLQMPIYGCNPDLSDLGNKSNSRKLFRECDLLVPVGKEDIYSRENLVDALVWLKKEMPHLVRAVIKLNEGFSGEGNAIFNFENISLNDQTEALINTELEQRMSVVAKDLDQERFLQHLQIMGAVVEEFVEGNVKMSPSVQCRINPMGDCKIISTHDQLIGGETGQVFLGAFFPARPEYSRTIAAEGTRVAEYLRDRGVLGRFGIDYVSVYNDEKWKNYAIEINLRKGGTTHPYILLQLLTDGDYNPDTGEFITKSGQKRFYFCTDNLVDEKYVGLTPPDLMEIAIIHNLQYNSSTQEGVMFHLIGALSQYGKVGVLCIGSSLERAKQFYTDTVKTLNKECKKNNRIYK